MLHARGRYVFNALIRMVLPTLIFGLTVGSVEAITYRTVALTGTQAHGTPAGVQYSDLTTAVNFNDVGQAAYQGTLIGPGVNDTNDTGIWSEGGGSLHLVAREGSQVPGEDPGVTFERLLLPLNINNAGQTAWAGRLINPDGKRLSSGIWLEGNGTFGPTMRLNHQVPGMDLGIEFFFYGARELIDKSGQSVLVAGITGPGVDDTNDRIIWRGAGNSGAVLVRKGEPAPGTESGVNFSNFDSPYIKGTGHIALRAFLAGPGVDNTNDLGLWIDGDGGFNLVARTGRQAPGTDPGVQFKQLGPFSNSLNDAGQVAFQGVLTGPGVDISSDTGIWSQDGGGLVLIAREGAPAPGMGPGIELGELGTGLSFNNAGVVGFQSQITGPGVDATNDSAIWLEDAGVVTLIARTGSQAPGTDPGTYFGSLIPPTVNNSGQLAFGGTLTSLGVDDTNDRGIWAQLGDSLELIAREGSEFEIAAGDTRVIDTLSFFGGHTRFNHLGQTLFHASFTDGSEGIFVAVPEPGTLAMLGFGVLMLLRRCGA